MKKKILIVDDDHDIHPLIVKIIEKVNKQNGNRFGEIDNLLADLKGQENETKGEAKKLGLNLVLTMPFKAKKP